LEKPYVYKIENQRKEKSGNDCNKNGICNFLSLKKICKKKEVVTKKKY
jgi:hypothetical protein